jgi:hypothetical protein
MASVDVETLIHKMLAGDALPEDLILNLVNRETGRVVLEEGQFMDFKLSVELSEPRAMGELAKDILGFSNSEGGLILVGASDDGLVVGHPIVESRKIYEGIRAWIGTRINSEAGNKLVTILGKNANVTYVLVRRTQSHFPELLRKDVELRPGLLRKVKYLRGSLPYRRSLLRHVVGSHRPHLARRPQFHLKRYRRHHFLLDKLLQM